MYKERSSEVPIPKEEPKCLAKIRGVLRPLCKGGSKGHKRFSEPILFGYEMSPLP